jgi:hypothetical protein
MRSLVHFGLSSQQNPDCGTRLETAIDIQKKCPAACLRSHGFAQVETLQTCLSFSRRDASELLQESLTPDRGRGECRVPDAPAASCAYGCGKCTRVFTAVTPEQPGIPARNGFTAYFVISPAIGFLATVISRIKVLSGPVEPN